MTKEDTLLERHFLDLANTACQRDIPVYSDFLSLYEQDLLWKTKAKLPPVLCEAFGGNSLAERKIAAFGPDVQRIRDHYPITVLEITPLHTKFSDELSHRDYLGALMNLGVERSVLGDILIREQTAYVYCKSNMSGFLLDNLSAVKHTSVSCKRYSGDIEQLSPQFEEIKASVASVRLDGILSAAFTGSRSTLSALISGRKVYVNGRLIEENSFQPKEGDIISVRGYGKFIFQGVTGQSKKGRCCIALNKYR